MAASSAALSTVPVGLCGEFTINALVRGVTARRKRVGVERKAATVGHQRHDDPLGAGHRHHRGVGVVERLDQDHLGAGLDQAEHCRRDGLGGADRHQHFGVRVVVDAEVPLALGGDGLAQRRDTDSRRVLVDALGDGVLGGLEHRRRPVFVGEALPEVHRADPGGQRRHLGEHRGRIGLAVATPSWPSSLRPVPPGPSVRPAAPSDVECAASRTVGGCELATRPNQQVDRPPC